MSPQVTEPSPRQFGNYEILSQLGKGGMAEVYRARVLTGPRQDWLVAVKRLLPELAENPEYVALFSSEGELSRHLNHPNIVRVLEVGHLDRQHFIAMELIDGRDLGQILRRCRQRQIPLPIDFAVFLARTILEALSYAHQMEDLSGAPMGLVHSDVSPSNVFISRVGEIKLGDFGIARAAAASAQPELVGKPFYLSPEVLDGEVTVASDLWAANVILYELLTLERPFQGKTPDEVFAAIRGRLCLPPDELRPEIPGPLVEIMARGFAEAPGDRFQTAAEFAAALEPHFDPHVGTPLAIAAVVRGLFGAQAEGS